MRLPGTITRFESEEELSRAAASRFVSLSIEATRTRGRFTTALSGGRTPRAAYELLATEHRVEIPWESVCVFWGDERYVPYDDPKSNLRMARKALLEAVPIPMWNIHPMPTHPPDPEEAARLYETTLRGIFAGPWPDFDLVLLGLGTDGHIASLFPGSPALEERDRWVVAVRAPIEPAVRLSVTLPVIEHARRVIFLVSGAEKQAAVDAVFGASSRRDNGPLPTDVLEPQGEVEWLMSGAMPPPL